MFRKYFLPLLSIAGVLFAIYSVIASTRVTPAAQPVVAPSQSPYVAQIAGSGLVEANSENISVATLVSGVIVDLPVTVDQNVAKGDVLFRLDDRDLQAQKKISQAALESAQRKYDKLKAAPRREELPPAEAAVATAEAFMADAKSQYQRAQELRGSKAISAEEITHRQYSMMQAEAALAQAKANLALLKAGTWAPDLEIAKAEVDSAKANLAAIDINLERLVVRAPIAGKVLQKNIRLGEYAQAGSFGGPATPLLLLGNVEPLYVRVDVDENDAWRVNVKEHPDAQGVVRGDPTAKAKLAFVRIEPYVIPKKSLTGDTTERVDTRVLQMIYSLKGSTLPVYPGQQMDIFIDAPAPRESTTRKSP
jgi:HlyD family secretion protein